MSLIVVTLAKCWVIRKSELGLEYQNLISGNPTSDVVINIKSLVWPGAHVFSKDGQQFRIYIGDGLKYEPESYYPSFDHMIAGDFEDPDLIYEHRKLEKKIEEDLSGDQDQYLGRSDQN